MAITYNKDKRSGLTYAYETTVSGRIKPALFGS